MAAQLFLEVVVIITSPLLASAFTVQDVTFLGNVTSSNTQNTRDLGYSGSIGATHINSYGDTIECGNSTAATRYTPPCELLASNSAAFQTTDPTIFTDYLSSGSTNSHQFCGYFPNESPADYGMGITNIIQTGPDIGIVYWWDGHKEPWYGDHTALVSPQDGYTYVFGATNTTLFYQGVYVARVPHGSETILSAYQYWDGSAYTANRVYNPSATQAVLGPPATQGQISWNPHLNSFLYLYTYIDTVFGKTAPKPEGPWSSEVIVYQSTGYPYVYSPCQMMQFDPSGKTLTVTYTAYSNIIQAIKILWLDYLPVSRILLMAVEAAENYIKVVEQVMWTRTPGLVCKPLEKRLIANGAKLRILPLGDSITYGLWEASGNSYRRELEEFLFIAGTSVEYIGTYKTGNWDNNANDGFAGQKIAEIGESGLPEIQAGNATIILLHAGTNDMTMHEDVENAPERLGLLIDTIIHFNPTALLLVAQIIPNADKDTQQLISNFNMRVPGIVKQRTKTGKKVRVVSMKSFPLAGLSDGIHPNELGYNYMANVWFQAIVKAANEGLIGDTMLVSQGIGSFPKSSKLSLN
ncbi:hypothetical protein B7494_g3682 [Chlorociboria aeruginascens]|nr:hypothetical protein B7494_g3682 [Chlorociboria aeruginascens]